MDKLRSSIEEANQAVDKEREKNVSLLHMIFPPDIAKRLWLGKIYSISIIYMVFEKRGWCEIKRRNKESSRYQMPASLVSLSRKFLIFVENFLMP